METETHETSESNVQPIAPTTEGEGFVMKYDAFERPEVFIPAFRKLYGHTGFPTFKQAYRIKKIGDVVQKELETYMNMLKEIDQQDPEAQKKRDDLHAIEFEVKWAPLSLEEIESVKGLSPTDILGIESLIDPKALTELS